MNSETINLTNLICDAINTIFFKIFSSIDNTIYGTLDNVLWINSDIVDNSKFLEIFGNSSTDGFLLIANSLILGIILFYVINFSISHLTYSKVDSPYQFIFKCIIFIACTNSSLWICKNIIYLVCLITDSIREIGFIINGFEMNFLNFIEHMNLIIYPNSEEFNIFSFNGILKLLSCLEIIYILINYCVRYIMCKILILISPFAFISLVNNKTDGFFKGWLKQFLIILLTQTFVAIVIVLAFSFELNNNDILSKILFFSTISIIAKCHFNLKSSFEFLYQYSKNTLKNWV